MNNKFEAQSTQKNLSQEMERLKAEDSGDEEEEPFRPAPKPGEGEHPLQYNYAIWFSRRSQSNKTVRYDQNLKFIASFASVEQFWNIYSYITRPSDMTGHVDYHLFKEGIRPMWEDEANKHGGKWIIRLKKGLASRCWENLIMAMLGEQFMVGEEICGAVISIRYQDDILSLWNRSNDQSVTTRIRDILQRVLNLPPNTIMEYKAHTESMKLYIKH
ncbi:eukaryotic translation initiation factor 4E type 2-like isoform X3 [Physella acuta]|uniref:eukaryotic translation initiation factor 4E type 2-like isoform X3 n=1 Tax=Physella acuta TaxID=109671 RepID=UPI0027DC2CDA|nr:eukaryotic translation initiation factor 4E type 2-like isoform X3 [Physella acuta]